MKHLSNVLLIIFIAAGLVVFQSCQKDELMVENLENTSPDVVLKKADKSRIFYGPTRPVGNGVARAWIKIDANDNPIEVGVNLSAKALENLPDHHAAFVLPLHKTKGKNFYDHVLLDWGPGGHEPPGIYDVPHFDVHFYIISVEERMAIEYQPDDLDPDPIYIPENYFRLPGVVPQMGSHWADATSPELPPTLEPFTHTFIYGSYNGEFIFWEPMVTRNFLLSKPDVEAMVKQPQAWQKDGWYPTFYKIAWSDRPGEYTIALTGLTWRDGQ